MALGIYDDNQAAKTTEKKIAASEYLRVCNLKWF